MARTNIPKTYTGTEIPSDLILSLKGSATLYVPATLFNGVVTKEGSYGAFNLGNSRAYAEFVVPKGYRDVEVWFTCGDYSDSLGQSGRSTSLRKLDESTGSYVVLNSNVPTTKTSAWFKYYGGLSPGRYRMYAASAYVQLNEMFMSGVADKKALVFYNGEYKTYSKEGIQEWSVVSEPLSAETFINDAMDLSSTLLDRRIEVIKKDLISQGSGIFKTTINLKRNPDIRKIEVK